MFFSEKEDLSFTEISSFLQNCIQSVQDIFISSINTRGEYHRAFLRYHALLNGHRFTYHSSDFQFSSVAQSCLTLLTPGTVVCQAPLSQARLTTNTFLHKNHLAGFPGGSVVRNPPTNAGDIRDEDCIPGSGRSPGAIISR